MNTKSKKAAETKRKRKQNKVVNNITTRALKFSILLSEEDKIKFHEECEKAEKTQLDFYHMYKKADWMFDSMQESICPGYLKLRKLLSEVRRLV